MAEYLSFGEIMLRLKTPGHERFFQSPSFEATFGGGEANVAVALSNYGLSAGFVSALPDNDVGNSAIGELKRFGVDTSHVRRSGERVVSIFWNPEPINDRPRSFTTVRTRLSASAGPEILTGQAFSMAQNGCTLPASLRR